jgi:hypothetical protein
MRPRMNLPASSSSFWSVRSSSVSGSGQNSQQSSIHSCIVPKNAGWRCSRRSLFFGLNGAAISAQHLRSAPCTRVRSQFIPRSVWYTRFSIRRASQPGPYGTCVCAPS